MGAIGGLLPGMIGPLRQGAADGLFAARRSTLRAGSHHRARRRADATASPVALP